MPRFPIAALAALALCPTAAVHAEDPFARALFLSKSSAYQHEVIAERDGAPSVVEGVLREILTEQNVLLDATKDASRITSEELAGYDLVIFYTQGDLTEPGLDKNPPMEDDGVAALLDWIEGGGGFIGFHSASDTLRPENAKDAVTPYTAMIGGAFRSHGRQFEGTVRAVDPDHPTLAGVPASFTINDEWYVFSHLDREDMHVLALLDPGTEGTKQTLYDVAPYPIAWCKGLGEGRVYYNAMGHRADVWPNPTFRRMIANAVQWALGQTDLDAEPNYGGTVAATTD